MTGAQEGQKRVSDLLELELQMAVNHCVGSENQTLSPLEKKPVLLTISMSFRPHG